MVTIRWRTPASLLQTQQPPVRRLQRSMAPPPRPQVAALLALLLTVNGGITTAAGTSPPHEPSRRLAIAYYESLSEPLFGAARHQRHIGSDDGETRMRFSAFSRSFDVLLRPDQTIFEPNIKVENSRGPVDLKSNQFFTGTVQGESGGAAHGFVTRDGRFRGALSSGSEVYVMEPAASAAKLSIRPLPPPHAHTIVYRLSDVAFNASHVSACSSESLGVRGRPSPPAERFEPILRGFESVADVGRSRRATETQSDAARRAARAVSSASSATNGTTTGSTSAVDPTKTTCPMYLQADFLFFEDQNYDEQEVIQQMVLHVQSVNEIFSIIDFDGDGAPDGIKMSVKGIKIWSDKNDPKYPYTNNYDATTFLQRFSQQDNFDAYCLAFLFTHRDFNDGTIGVAWTASLTQDGGICQKNGLAQGVATSMNTGILTTISYGSEVPFAISRLTFAHEMGHAMGSQHDADGTSCAPGGSAGNYIMHAKSSDATKPNNNKLSNCSITLINTVLKAKARSSTGCFTSNGTSLCGNKVVDPGEQCDCGWDSGCYEDCCVPQSSASSAASQGTPCTLQPWATCSPSQGSCCSGLCVYETAGSQCRSPTACRASSYCSGTSYTCPASYLARNLTRCSLDGGVCYNGACTTRLCEANSLVSCQCNPIVAGDWQDSRLCSLCCVDPTDSMCKIANINKTTGVVFGFGNSSFSAASGPGQLCYNSSGYCDRFRVCRQANPEGPLTELFSELFSSQTATTIVNILNEYWWSAVGAIAVLIICMALFIKFCSRRDIDHLHKDLEVVDGKKMKGKPYSTRLKRLVSRRVAPEELDRKTEPQLSLDPLR